MRPGRFAAQRQPAHSFGRAGAAPAWPWPLRGRARCHRSWPARRKSSPAPPPRGIERYLILRIEPTSTVWAATAAAASGEERGEPSRLGRVRVIAPVEGIHGVEHRAVHHRIDTAVRRPVPALAVCSVCAVIRFQSGMVSAWALGMAASSPMRSTDDVTHRARPVPGSVRQGRALIMCGLLRARPSRRPRVWDDMTRAMRRSNT